MSARPGNVTERPLTPPIRGGAGLTRVVGVNANLVVISSSPALVQELAPGDEAGARLLDRARELVDQALQQRQQTTGSRPVIELVGSADPRWHTQLSGSFRAWGAPEVSVGQGHHLPELVSRYVLAGRAAHITTSRDRLGTPDPEVLTVVAVDGSAGLTERAPLALLDAAGWADQWCSALLDHGPDPSTATPTAAALRAAGVLEPELWLELADLKPARTTLLAHDTTLGVGRYIAGWEL